MEVVTDLAFPIPAKTIAALIGVPDEDWAIFRRWVVGQAGLDISDSSDPSEQGQHLAGQSLFVYFMDLLAKRQHGSQGDVLSTLSVAEIDGHRLSDLDLVKFCILLLFAGQETTKSLITNGIYFLTEYSELQDQLRRQPELIPAAVEEILRCLPPIWSTFRRTTTEVNLGGQVLPEGAMVQVWNLSANHDPEVFADPERLNLQRANTHHMAFGHGVHFCLGAPLARLEANILFRMLLEQFHDLRRVPDAPVLIRSGLSSVVLSLPMTFQARV